MTIKVYNTLTRTKEPFKTIEPGKVGMYLCGPTVYKPAHIGHMVGPVIFDTVKRYLTYIGYDVTYVINITDVDDKLINKANEKGMTVEALAKEMTADYFENLATMGVDTVDKFPYATEHIQEMLDIIQKLVDDGYAYPLDGDVYFETTKDEKYGSLSGRKLDEIMAGTRVEATDKKHHPADFALWKKSKTGEPSWESPWGDGRPGWHIECSAMSMKYIGETLDIHGGGLDLMFPHHENELAQSECCTGKPFATYWMHNGLMQASGESGKVGGGHDKTGDLNTAKEAQEVGKLAGSKGADSVKLMFEKFDPETIRFFLLATHYRSPIDFSQERIAEIEKSIEGFYRLFETYGRITGKSFYDLETSPKREESVSLEEAESELLKEIALFRTRFWEAMDDDFNTGGGVGILHEMRKAINAFITSEKLGDNSDQNSAVMTLTTAVGILKELSNLLGVFRKPLQKDSAADDEFVNGLMNLIIDLRAEARETKNWGIADRIRDGLSDLKVVLEDRTGDTLWRRE
ncbi:MAG: cysteine--tRNA ligase [Planctomycetaceae bacterium]|jgi:cysteinyl-tRNA synthetase|nr:cysteine--tRNA ligase [Planctomycetaceae bacterium]